MSTSIILSFIIIVLSICLYLKYTKPIPESKCPECPESKCPESNCPECKKLTTYNYSEPRTFPVGEMLSVVPCLSGTAYSKLVLGALVPPNTKTLYLPGGDENNPICESGDTLNTNSMEKFCENNGGLVSNFVAGYDNDTGICSKTYYIGKSGQIYNMTTYDHKKY
jgi:hypothetical protein